MLVLKLLYNKILTFSIILILSSCNLGIFKQTIKVDGKQSIANQTPFLMRNLPKGDDSYSQGFRKGCVVFSSIVGGGILRVNNLNLDGYRLARDKLYTRGFMDAASYCTFFLDWDTH